MASSSSSSSSDSSAVNSAISEYKQAQQEASAESMKVATQVTRINGVYNAIKKISPA